MVWKWVLPAVFGFLAIGLGVAPWVGCRAFSAPGYRGPKSGHFDGKRFHNQNRGSEKGFGSVLKWVMNRRRDPWKEYTHHEPGPPPPALVGKGKLRVTVINHSTVLLQTDGLNILTDPIFSKRASPVGFAGPKRRRPPGIRFSDLPPIDLVVISHNHYDHLDIPTLKRLKKRWNPLVLAGLGNGALLKKEGLDRIKEMDWWDQVKLGSGTEVVFVPAQHFSGRGLCDRNKTLWGGFVILSPSSRIYFAGDTGYGPHFRQIGKRYGPFDLSLLPIGAFRPRWFMRAMHISPQEAVKAHYVVGSKISLGIHYGTFSLADDGQKEPVRELKRALAQARNETVFWTLPFGRGRWVPLKETDSRVKPRIYEPTKI